MYRSKTVAVVVPAYNEADRIRAVIETMPDFIDHIVIVDDASEDETREAALSCGAGRIVVLRHDANQGVGGAIVTGYKWVRERSIDLTAVMAGDGQMDPSELARVLDPLVDDLADYSKGNRYFGGEAWDAMPRVRFFGNATMSLLAKAVTGYWHVSDVPCGYAACNLEVLRTLPLDRIYRRYGMPVSMLVLLNIDNFRVCEVTIRPLYGVGEQSKLRVRKVVFTISWLMFKLFFLRMWQKYVVRDFHPLVLFYVIGMALLALGAALSVILLFRNWNIVPALYGPLQLGWIILAALCLISGFQFVLFGTWFDMDYNKPNCVVLRGRGRRR
jgi:glycosyltransferase involved in cell wall biosynthesis